jgi:anthranilate synthase component I
LFVRTLLSDSYTPLALFHHLRSRSQVACLLESTDGDSRLARYSFIGVAPSQWVAFYPDKVLWHTLHQGRIVATRSEPPATAAQHPLAQLKAAQPTSWCEALAAYDPTLLAQWPFLGGWVGVLGYGATAYFDGITQATQAPFNVPYGQFALYDSLIAFDHLKKTMAFISFAPLAEAKAAWADLQQALTQLSTPPPLQVPATLPSQADLFAHPDVSSAFSQPEFEAKVRQTLELVAQGDVFQLVLANRYSQPFTPDALTAYRLLTALNPSPYAFLLQWPGGAYVGSSPETFVNVRTPTAAGASTVALHALAGTRPRGDTPTADAALEASLLADAKELAEHRMLVDLARNDLGRVCQVGSVAIGPLAQVVRYTHVMHLATEVSGTLSPQHDAYDVAKSCFPRGTLSGAPKHRAMQHIATLEHEHRGYYSGFVGCLDPFGRLNACIAIRAALLVDGWAHVHAGAGIVADSQPAAEYQETRNKATSVMLALALAKALAEPVTA